MSRPLIIGLTGSIGMGKSTVAAMFEAAGVPVFDADAEVMAMQGPGGELVAAIEHAFPGTTDESGVSRETLGALVFGNAAELLLQPDHYLFRMLYSQGLALEDLGVRNKAVDPRAAWRLFAQSYWLFRGTPSRMWRARGSSTR